MSDVECQLSAKRADTIPAVFTDIHLHFVVKGSAIKEAQVKKPSSYRQKNTAQPVVC